MENEIKQQLPALPDEGEVREERYKHLEPFLLDASKNYPEPYYLLEYQGVPLSPLGGIQACSGQKKNGKTFLLAQLMAAILGVNSQRVKRLLPGLQVPQRTLEHLGHLPTVLYVDTEMEQLNSAKVLRRVHWLCEWQMDLPCERFHVLWLRSVTGDEKEPAYRKRYNLIKEAIDFFNPDAVFIDGIRDIIGDFNDNEESSRLVTELMAIAQQGEKCIWNTLHMNPRPKNDDESKMRGHLGTELGNKITDTLVCIKHKEGDGNVWFEVRQDDARDKDMENWEFVVTDAAGALGVPQMRKAVSRADADDLKRQAAINDADKIFHDYPWTSSGATYTDIQRYMNKKGITSHRKIEELFNIGNEEGIIYKTGKRGKYYYNGLNKETPNDKPEDLPFGQSENEDAPY